MKHYPQPSMDEPEEVLHDKSSLFWRRCLVLALYLSFAACLLALWLTGSIIGDPGQFLPAWLMHAIENNRLSILILPLISLIACYFTLRHITSDIMGYPDRFLDERQKMVRDQAHRSAYRLIKLACLLIPLAFFLHSMLGAGHNTPVPAQYPAGTVNNKFLRVMYAVPSNLPIQIVSSPHSNLFYVFNQQANPAHVIYFQSEPLAFTIIQQPVAVSPVSPAAWPNDPSSTGLFYGVLLLCLFLMVTVLPMSILAWKERV